MEKNEIKLTVDLYESIIDALVRDVVEFKREQGESINKISIIKETLIAYKKQLKNAKKNIKATKRMLKTEKGNLRRINSNLQIRKYSITELNSAITSQEERTIDLTEYSLGQIKKR